ncbi:MAG: hypothetical protein ACLS8R_09690 [Anaeromassilibacillus sp.]
MARQQLWRFGRRWLSACRPRAAAHQPVLFGEWHWRGVEGAAARWHPIYPEMIGAFPPYAVEVYRRFGLCRLGEREENGIRHTPMVCRHWF